MSEHRKVKFLKEVNSRVPADIDWKQGARAYLSNLLANPDGDLETFHLLKPFRADGNFDEFFSEMYGFLNMIKLSKLKVDDRVLDVACGPGWTSHYLAKLGMDVLGIDISRELVNLAEKRVRGESFGTYPNRKLNAKFVVHDIEEAPLPQQEFFEFALFESALHHFYDPVSALSNVAESLKPEGIIGITEGVAPALNSKWHLNNLELMERYHTLERPYSRAQLIELLEICGFGYYEFFSKVNGFFNPNRFQDIEALKYQVMEGTNANFLIASRSPAFFEQNRADYQRNCTPFLADIPSFTPSTQQSRRFFPILLRGLARIFLENKNENFVYKCYVDILNRTPDPGGFYHALDQLDKGKTRLSIVKNMLGSEEFRKRS